MARPISRNDSAFSPQLDFEHFYATSIAAFDLHNAGFRDIDEPEGLQTGLQAITSCINRNFVLDFSDHHAWAGFELSSATIMDLIKTGGWPGEASTRWIDISFPTKSKDLLEKLAYHYDFSPRLLAMMCSEPQTAKSSTAQENDPRKWPSSKADSLSSSQTDVERVAESIDRESLNSTNPARTGNLYELLEEVWHYTCVDQGANYLCLGYNSIYSTGGAKLSQDQLPSQARGPIPGCVGAWTWLILCKDRTIISINEDLFPNHHGRLSAPQKSIYLRTIQNVVNVFRSLSLAMDPTASRLNRLPIRKRLAEGDKAATDRARDAPGLLFYFLFENWFNSYSLVTRRDSRYGTELQKIRSDMFKRPDLTQIERLDQVGNDLNILKRHYKSYIRIIDRITEVSGSSDTANMSSSQVTARMVDGDDEVQAIIRPSHVDDHHTQIGINPGPAACVRFERLKDMITLYALSEVKDYLEKKQALVDMNFQLIAIKESRDVERLTRVGLFITKATILFLPVNLMTAYFGSNLSNQEYTVAQYWISFCCILVGSYVLLMGFGVVSGTMENWTFVSPLRTRIQNMRRRK
ncbi:hypothetical protein K461DRAFT_318652 [Myriangium duriaei CBS 260.36]|uniref:Uncharacterized protein n=1 Tax=Myriangium duriaei CBS 260.36 TaxID=1168546 RepID=A0A9P4J9P0_9PEZI|nr:hypothetical protein K461DRAFT_318652 [Myriangium duriaei CBS 260.36]